MARTSRAEVQIGKRTSTLNGGTDSASKIEASAARHLKASAEPDPKASRDWRQRIARLVVFHIRVLLEWSSQDFVQLCSLTALRAIMLVEAGFFGFICRSSAILLMLTRFRPARLVDFARASILRFLGWLAVLVRALRRSLVFASCPWRFALDISRARRG